MEFTYLPGDIARLVALGLSLNDVKALILTNRALHREVGNHSDHWRRRYIQDYGDPHVLDDLDGYDWKGKYRFRQGMDRIYGCEPLTAAMGGGTVHAKRIIPIFEGGIVIVNTDDTFDYVGVDGTLHHHDIKVTKVSPLFKMFDKEPKIYALTPNGRVLCVRPANPGSIRDTDLPDAADIFNYSVEGEYMAMIGIDNNLYRSFGIFSTDLKVKGYSGGSDIFVIIDMDNNVWYTHEQEGISADSEWIQIPDIKGKSVCAWMGVIITDLDDNLWGFGDNEYRNLGIGDIGWAETPVRLGITGRTVQMECATTTVIDMDYNLWLFGSNFDDMPPVNTLLGRRDSGDIIDVPRMVPNFKGIDARVSMWNVYLIGDYY